MTEVRLPQSGMGMREGTIIVWLRQPGDPVAKGEALVEIGTAKVETEVEAPVSGVLFKLLVAEGETVPVRTVIAIIDEQPEAAWPTT